MRVAKIAITGCSVQYAALLPISPKRFAPMNPSSDTQDSVEKVIETMSGHLSTALLSAKQRRLRKIALSHPKPHIDGLPESAANPSKEPETAEVPLDNLINQMFADLGSLKNAHNAERAAKASQTSTAEATSKVEAPKPPLAQPPARGFDWRAVIFP